MIYRYLFVSLLKVLTFLGYLVKQIIHHKLTKETREKEWSINIWNVKMYSGKKKSFVLINNNLNILF